MMDRTRESLPAVLPPLKLYLFQHLPQHTTTAVTPCTPDPAAFPRKGPVLLPECFRKRIGQKPAAYKKKGS